MARLDCFKGPDVGRATHEWARDRNLDGSWAFKSKSKIDPARTKYNYAMEDGRADDRLRRRLADPGLKVDKRSHVNQAGVWVVTCPQELKDDPDAVARFFEVVYDFTKERYGAENVLQGYVHMDETTPHIHMPVVPVKDGRVSAKAVFNRRELPAYQRELDKVMAAEFGQKGLILNGRTKGGYTTEELRERTRQEAELKQMAFEAKGTAIFAEARAWSANQDAEKARQEAQEAREQARRDADDIRAAARQEAAQEAAKAVQEARRAAAVKDAFAVSLGRRHKQDAAKLRRRERELREREAALDRREADVDRRERDVADREAALDVVGKAILRRQKEAEAKRQEERNRERVRDGVTMTDGLSAGVPGHGPKGRTGQAGPEGRQ